MNSFKKFLSALAVVTVLAVGSSACSSDVALAEEEPFEYEQVFSDLGLSCPRRTPHTVCDQFAREANYYRELKQAILEVPRNTRIWVEGSGISRVRCYAYASAGRIDSYPGDCIIEVDASGPLQKRIELLRAFVANPDSLIRENICTCSSSSEAETE